MIVLACSFCVSDLGRNLKSWQDLICCLLQEPALVWLTGFVLILLLPFVDCSLLFMLPLI